jgi:photosystem II stability/assembly factor-like uncharacterized protein
MWLGKILAGASRALNAFAVSCGRPVCYNNDVKLCWIVLPLVLLATSQALAQDPISPPDSGPGTPMERKRAEYFARPRMYPLGFIPAEAIAQTNAQMDRISRNQKNAPARPNATGLNLPSLSSTSWTSIGPQPTRYQGGTFSGWTNALAVDPRNSNVVYAGSPGGGIWKTTTGGTAWVSLTDNVPSNSIGAIALAPSNPDIVYAGTGDYVFFYGAGILKSTNGGASWTHLPGPFAGPTGTSPYFFGGAKIQALAVDPTNPNHLLAGVFKWPLTGAGIYRSTDGGSTWNLVLSGGRGTSLFFDRAAQGTVWAAIGEYYSQSQNGVWRSTDNGQTWTRMASLPTANSAAIYLEQGLNPNALYASVTGTGGNTLGLYRSGDNGASWNRITIPSNLGSRGVTIAVWPRNSDVIFAGDLSLMRSLDRGATWTSTPYTFGDYRSFAFNSDASRLYVGDDGGIWATTNIGSGAVTWSNLNNSLSLALWYPGMALHPTDANIAQAGAQDQGVQLYAGTLAWDRVVHCDGGWNAIDFVDPRNRYTDCQNIDVQKSTNGGVSWTRAMTGINTSDRAIFIPPLVMDPSNASTLYYGTNRVYQTTNAAALWTPISPVLGSVTSMAVAPSDRNTVYAVTESGVLSVTRNALAGSASTWTQRNSGLPNRAYTNLAVDPANPSLAYLTVSGFTFGSDTAGHVFRTLNGGVNWTDISGNLPNTPANDIVVDPDLPNTLYLGTDVGVFKTTNGGVTWDLAASGLPRVVVTSVRLHRPSRILRAGTFGRGAWDLAVPLASNNNPLPQLTGLSPATAFAGSAAFTLTVTGNSFVSGASVLWNGSPRSTTFVDASTLRASVTGTDLATAGAVPVTVSNPAPGGGISNAINFVVAPVPPQTSGQGSHYVPITPCRAADTRSTSAITAITSRDFGFATCNIPSNATALALNVTVVPIRSLGYLSIWPAGTAQPVVSTLNSLDGRIKANSAIVGAGRGGQVSVFVTDTAHVILDVNGYFVPVGTPGALAFYPASPCRALDTRVAGSGGALGRSETRRIPGGSGACLASGAQAYSLNMTVVPTGPLGYLTMWPAGNSQPQVSTLNALTGTIAANAAILAAGTAGAVDAFVTDPTHLIADANGYFAPPGSPGALAFYPVQPCRISDTRNTPSAFGSPRFEADASRDFPVTAAGCSIPTAAQAYVLNATVVPPGVFGFLSLWPSAQARPTVSTLNAIDGALTSNMAIVPASSGSIRAYTSSPTHLLLDISGYFAP